MIGRMPKWFEAVFNTPSHHRVHHGSDVEYLDKNHAGTLIIWDKLFGTYQEETFTPKYGLTENIKSFNPLQIVLYEWKKIYRDMKTVKSVKYKMHYLYKPPGWSCDGNSKTAAQLQTEIKYLNRMVDSP